MQTVNLCLIIKNLVMKKLLASFCVLMLLSCSNRKERNSSQQTNVPEALQENKESKSIGFKKRGSEDILEELYEEKVKSTPVLQDIEAMIDRLKGSHNDSLEVYNDFNAKNLQYYNSARSHLSSVKDSLLEKEIKTVVERSIAEYDNKISRSKNFVTILNSKPGSVNDRYTVLKVLVSLDMMKEYQEKNIPSPKPIESVINNYNNLIQKMDSVISKNK